MELRLGMGRAASDEEQRAASLFQAANLVSEPHVAQTLLRVTKEGEELAEIRYHHRARLPEARQRLKNTRKHLPTPAFVDSRWNVAIPIS